MTSNAKWFPCESLLNLDDWSCTASVDDDNELADTNEYSLVWDNELEYIEEVKKNPSIIPDEPFKKHVSNWPLDLID